MIYNTEYFVKKNNENVIDIVKVPRSKFIIII